MREIMPGAREQLEIIRSGTDEIVPEDELLKKLERSVAEGRPLRIKQGFDPTAPDIHLGHAVGLRKLRQFQDLGHTIVLIVGDYTGMVGDPSDRSATRPRLTHEQVARNAETYLDQFFRILDRQRTEVRRNGEWFQPMSFEAVMDLASRFTIARVLERDDFAKRFREQKPISLHELFYPIMQGYDSVQIRSDVEIGATEQKFNLLVGRQLQQEFGQEPQVILTLPILVGVDGKSRMSKSLGNYIGITEAPATIFGKLMSIPDAVVLHYYTLTTPLSPADLKKVVVRLQSGGSAPRDVKAELAEMVVSMYHGPESGRSARAEFDRVFREGGLPDEIPEVRVPAAPQGIWIVQLLAETSLVPSRGEARRMVRQGAVSVDGEVITTEEAVVPLEAGTSRLLRVGKRRFLRIVPDGGNRGA
jgi:tyrosyl-tRNA synthetase